MVINKKTERFFYKWFLKHDMAVYIENGIINVVVNSFGNIHSDTIVPSSPPGEFLLKYAVNK